MNDHEQELLRIARDAKEKQEQSTAAERDVVSSEEMRHARAVMMVALFHMEFVRTRRVLRAIGLSASIKRENLWIELSCGKRTVKLTPPHKEPSVRLVLNGSSSAKTIEWKATDENECDDMAAFAQGHTKEIVEYLAPGK